MNSQKDILNSAIRKLSMECATHLLVTTVSRNIIEIIKNSEENVVERLGCAADYLKTLSEPTRFYLNWKRTLLDFFHTLNDIAGSQLDQKLTKILAPLMKLKIVDQLAPVGCSYIEPRRDEYCTKCKVIVVGHLKQKDGALNYEKKEDELMWINYLGKQLKFTIDTCSCPCD